VTPTGTGSRPHARRVRAALFDMDGLLVDSEPLWREAEIDVFARHGLVLTDDECRRTQGKVIGEVVAMWFERHPWPGATPDAVTLEVLDAVEALLHDRATLMPGAHHALESCRARGLRLALASSSPRRLIDTVVRALGLGAVFEVIHSAELERAGKPDPAVFLTTARLLRVSPAECVVFEDAPAGVEAAKAAGMACVAVPERPVEDAARFIEADVVLTSLAEVDDALWLEISPGSG
jgi:mannitol-1-/sugar-/sorbitol-6-/2-deoxyglucose-6-phosphatase